MFERRKGSWLVLGSAFTKSQLSSALANDSQANVYRLLKDPAPICRGQPTSSWLGGRFAKEQFLPNSQETACEVYPNQGCQKITLPASCSPLVPGVLQVSPSQLAKYTVGPLNIPGAGLAYKGWGMEKKQGGQAKK